jgi:hypothetical protein
MIIDEGFNADLKYAMEAKVPARTKAKWKTATTEHMIKLEEPHARAMSLFQDPRAKYAA